MSQLVGEEGELLLPTSRAFVTKLLGELDGGIAGLQDRAATAAADEVQNANPLNNVSEKTRKQLLALQVLFPNEFVPALDLLDRHLVTRFRIRQHRDVNPPVSEPSRNDIAEEPVDEPMRDVQTDTPTTPTHPHESEDADTSLHGNRNIDQTRTTDAAQANEDLNPSTYYVRSAQQRSSRYSTSFENTTYYEVRLQAWNCSCPAFAFAAFPAVHPEPAVPMYNPSIEYNNAGGLSGDGAEDDWTFGGVSLGENMPPMCKHLLACVLVEKCRSLFGGFVEERNVSVEEAAGWAAGWGD